MYQMKKFLAIFFILAVFIGCADSFQEEIEETQAKIEEVKRLIDNTNTTLASVQQIVASLSGDNLISSVDPVMESGRQTGYSISFLNGKNYNVILGLDGLDGYAPSFSVKEDSDGHYYWILDGQWLLSPSGDRLRADGLEPSDVVVPQMRVENGYWEISTNGGASWTRLAEENDIFYFRIITDIDLSSDSSVTFILSDGSKLEIPRYVPISLTLGSVSEEKVISPGEVITIPYKVEGSITDELVVTSGTDGIYTSEIVGKDAREGVIKVTCPYDYSDGYVFIMAHDGGFSTVKMISFTQRKIEIEKGLSYKVNSEGGIIAVPYRINFDFDLEFEGGTEEWISVLSTKAATVEGKIVLSIALNDTDEVRTGVIHLHPSDNQVFTCATITVTQASSYFSMDVSRIQAGSDGGDFNIEMSSSRGVSAEIPDSCDWLGATLSSEGDYHSLTLKVAKNHSSDQRTRTVDIYTSDGKTLQGRITVVQNAWDLDHVKDMVFQARANLANDWTVYIPIRGEMNCYVDWGDGNVEIIDKTTDRLDENFTDWVYHKYDTSLPASYRVSVAGSVEALNGRNMPNKGGITTIEQWGDVGLRHMCYAFEGFPRLFSIPADPIGGLKEVKDFGYAFRNCIYLTDIDKDFLACAVKAESLNDLFQSCRRLRFIPDGLLRNCSEARNMESIFSDCGAITDIPENLFWGCPKVESFASAFNSTGIRNIPELLFAKCPEVISFSGVFSGSPVNDPPENLFANNTKVREFNRAFYYCHDIHSIPEKLFANNPEVTTFEGTFGQDYGLKEVPVGLFDNNRKVLDFGATFWDIRFENPIDSPYTMIDGKKVHLYERIDYPDHFITPSYTASCFTDGWTDSNSIPIEWK